MASSVLNPCVCYDLQGNPTTHNFGQHTSACMIPVTVTSDDGLLIQNFNIPAWWGQLDAPFTAADAQNTVTSFETQVENQEQMTITSAKNPPVAWYSQPIAANANKVD